MPPDNTGFDNLDIADANLKTAVAAAVDYIGKVPSTVQAAVDAAKAGDNVKAQSIADDLTNAANALTTALPSSGDPGTTEAQANAAKAAVANV